MAPSTSHNMPTARDTPPHRAKKAGNMAEMKLDRLRTLTDRLKEDLARIRIPASQAAIELIEFINSESTDFMVPTASGKMIRNDNNPYAAQPSGGCCLVM